MDLFRLLTSVTSSLQSTLVAIFAILIISYAIKWLASTKRNLPPGPYGFPLVGYIPFMKEDINGQFRELGKKYGKIFSIKLGSIHGIVVQDNEVLKEFFSRSEFLNKPTTGPMDMIPNSMGFSLKNGKIWEEQRKHSLMMMRNAGMGKSFFEDEVHEEIRLILNRIEEKKGKPTDIREDLFDSLCNILWMLLFGYRLESTDSRRSILYNSMFKMTAFLSSYMILYYYPWLRTPIKVLKPKAYRELIEHYKVFESMIDQQIEDKKKHLKDKPARDFTDFFLEEMAAQAGNPNTSFTTEMMKGNVLAYFGAGIFTTQTSIVWLLLTLAAYPETQGKIYEEIQNVTGNSREVVWDDKKSMPFTMGVIYEMQRWKTMAPVGDFRTCYEDTKFMGFDIPKGSIIFPHLWAPHHDPKLWKEPNKFKPERFISADGKSNVKPPGYYAFTQGRRNCPGEQVSYFQIFLFITWILQKYQVKPEPGKKIDIETEEFMFINMPLAQNVCFIKRQ